MAKSSGRGVGESYSAEAQAYMQKLTANGVVAADIDVCDKILRFINGESVIIGTSEYSLGTSLLANTHVIISNKGGCSIRESLGKTYITKAYNLICDPDANTDYSNDVELSQPQIINGSYNFNQAQLDNNTWRLNMLAGKRDVVVFAVKQWTTNNSPANHGRAFGTLTNSSPAPAYPSFITMNGEQFRESIKFSYKTTSEAWAAVTTDAFADSTTYSINTWLHSAASGAASLYLNDTLKLNVTNLPKAAYANLDIAGSFIGRVSQNAEKIDCVIVMSFSEVVDVVSYVEGAGKMNSFLMALYGIV